MIRIVVLRPPESFRLNLLEVIWEKQSGKNIIIKYKETGRSQ
jgi:hypothetical protein